ncbi:MAG: BrnT family toxin [Devosia sp.]
MVEWDEEKNRSNIVKHRLGFARASQIFARPIWTVVDDRFDYGEIRRVSVGMMDDGALVTVVHTRRDEITRIISARPASRMERMRYGQETS